LIVLEDENKKAFRAFLARPGSVIPGDSWAMSVVGVLSAPIYPTLSVKELAAAMIELAVAGGERQIVMHEDLKERGRALLATV
jgi:hypothetical protein